MLTNTVTNIPFNYETANHNIAFDIAFGEGKDGAVCKNEKERKNFTKNYDVEVFESGKGDDYMKGYRVIANEGPLVIRIGDIRIHDENSKYEYALGFALDGKEPEYNYEASTLPRNIKRDGSLWTIPANEGNKEYNFDQNPDARFQWVTAKALDDGYKPTEEELELGMEESTQNTGMIYLTFMVFRKLKPVSAPVSRGFSSGVTRGSVTRGSSAARFGYGNETVSASVKSEFEFVEGSEKYVLPIRLRIAEESEKTKINCSQHLAGANLNTLRRQTMTVPF
jgi:hypothetical protein